MKFLLILLVFLTGCGDPLPCDEDFDLYEEEYGLCIKSNGFPVNMVEVNMTLGITETAYNSFFTAVSLGDIVRETETTLIYDEFLGRVGLRGITIPRDKDPDTCEYGSMLIGVLGQNCWTRNYVMGHEMLHVISQYNGIPIETNASHLVENVFLVWATQNEVPRGYTAEAFISTAMEYYCEKQMTAQYGVP